MASDKQQFAACLLSGQLTEQLFLLGLQIQGTGAVQTMPSQQRFGFLKGKSRNLADFWDFDAQQTQLFRAKLAQADKDGLQQGGFQLHQLAVMVQKAHFQVHAHIFV